MENLNIIAEKTISAANKRIDEFRKSGEFNPLDALMNTEAKDQQIFSCDVDFLVELEKLIEKHSQDLNKIVFGGGTR